MSRFHTPGVHRFNGVSLLTLPILCAFALSLTECDRGVGEVAAIDGAASGAAAAAATDVAAEATADAVTETAIAGSTDIALGIEGDVATVEPFSVALKADDCAEGTVVGVSGVGSDGTTIAELDNKVTGDLRMVAMTTRAIYDARRAFLGVQHKRQVVQAVEKRGQAPVWGHFTLGDTA